MQLTRRPIVHSASCAILQNVLRPYSLYSTSSQAKPSHRFVPPHEGATGNDIKNLSEFVNSTERLLAITGKFTANILIYRCIIYFIMANHEFA